MSNRTRFAGIRNAVSFAYGINPNVAPLVLASGGGPGSGVVFTVQVGFTVLEDGTILVPLSTTAPIQIGVGSNAETVTPSAVSTSTPTVPGTVSFTATVSNAHGAGDLVCSGSFGIAEAVNEAHAGGGGLVAFDAAWVLLGGATSQFASKTYGWANVTMLDWRGTTSAKSWTASNGGAYTASANTIY